MQPHSKIQEDAILRHELQQRSRQGHRPGDKHTLPDGVEYLVTETGSWRRLTPRIKNPLDHNNSKRRRFAALKF